MLTRKQHELICFIQDRLSESGVSPSFEEMKEALELKSKSGVHRLISALEERGYLRRLPNRARALEVLKTPERPDTKRTPAPAPSRRAAPEPANDVIEIPLHGRIAAGVPIEAFEGASMLSVPAALLGSGEHYALEVSGDSLVEKKPHPLPLLHACARLGSTPAFNLHIGDSRHDASCARAAGCPVFLVPYGYNEGGDVRKLDCDAIVESLDHAADLIFPASAAQ